MEIQWSPNHDDRFYTFGTNLCLYRVCEIGNDQLSSKNEVMKISEIYYAELINIKQDVQFKCVAWQPDSNPDHLMALGMPNGKVVLTSFINNSSKNNRELVLKHNRPALQLAWNYLDNNLLGVVMDKAEKSRCNPDPAIIVWDVKNQENFIMEKKISISGGDPLNKPLAEIGPSDTCSSFAWFAKTPKTFIAGLSGKYLKVFDIKESNKCVQMANTKAVYSITINSFDENYIASFNEQDEILIQDLRRFDKPVVTIYEKQKIKSLAWSLTSGNSLGCCFSASPNIKFFNMHSHSDVLMLPYIERSIQTVSPISSFNWHHTNKGRFLVVSQNATIADYTLTDRILIDMSPSSCLGYAKGQNIEFFNSLELEVMQNDIAEIMRKRAAKRYGLKKNLNENISIVNGDQTLEKLWAWISSVKPMHSLEENRTGTLQTFSGSQMTLSQISRTTDPSSLVGKLQSPSSPDFGQLKIIAKGDRPPISDLEGIKGVLISIGLNSKQDNRFLEDVVIKGQLRKRWETYVSEERCKIIELCGWQPGKENNFRIIESLKKESKFERAAAISVFNLQIRKAIEILTTSKEGARTSLCTVAMALAGYQEDDQNLWRDVCSDLILTLNDPYLKAIFYFLTTKNFDEIVKDIDLELADRVAFAAIYLPDESFKEFIEEQMDYYINDGNPLGILLTGVTDLCIPLFANYIDKTGDIQTPVLIIAQVVGDIKFEEFLIFENWLDEYRDFLDRLEMWIERAELDVYIQKVEASTGPGKLFNHMHDQVHIICNFCAKPIYNDATRNRTKNYSSNIGGQSHVGPLTPTNSGMNPLGLAQRIQSCPHCRKELPRCSICMLYLGTAAGTSLNRLKITRPTISDKKLSKIADWFVWCRTCFHGGHAEHMSLWFKMKSECPVSSCMCNCASLDFKSRNQTPLQDSNISNDLTIK